MNKILATTAFLLTVWIAPEAAFAGFYAKFQDIEGSTSSAASVGALGVKNCKGRIGAIGKPNIHRATAYQSALQKWSIAVDLRYGHPYSFWSKAKSKKTSCSRIVLKNKNNGWRCKVSATPCR